MKKRKTPAIRFKGFTDDWEQYELGNTCDITSGLMGNSILKNGKYTLSRIETIATGKINKEKIGYTNIKPNSNYLLNLGDILYSNINSLDHIGKVAIYEEFINLYHGINLLRLIPNNTVFPKFLFNLLNSEKPKKWAKTRANQAVSQASINQTLLSKQKLYIPHIVEQQQIGEFFSKLDNLITFHQRKYEKLQILKKAMLEKMFPKNGAKIPEIRFKGFNDDWEQYELRQLGTIAMNKRIFKHQTSSKGEVPFYKIGTFGGTPDAFIPKKLFEKYKINYPYPQIGDVLISASGSIGKTVVYSGKDEYFQDSNIVWLKHDNRLINSFLKYFYSIVKWEGIEGSTIQRLYNNNILNTKISMPLPNEQYQIGSFFDKLDNLITLHQRKIEKLQTIKKAMLEKMFI